MYAIYGNIYNIYHQYTPNVNPPTPAGCWGSALEKACPEECSRDRQRQIETDRDRETDRQRQTDRDRETERDRERERQRDRQTDRQTDR